MAGTLTYEEDPVSGGVFSLFDGHIIGRILELVPNQRIVEAWRVIDWPAGVFPEGLKEHLSIGWQQHYRDALVKYLQ